MSYLTFRPTKESVVIPKLVKCLSIIADAFLILLLIWNLVNICYPFWGRTNYGFIWIGFIPYVFYYWVIERFKIRSFMVSMFPPNSRYPSDEYQDLKYCGFLFSVWENPDGVTFGYYHKKDQVNCLRTRIVTLGSPREYWKYIGWLIVLLTDAIPIVLFAALFSAGYYLGIGTVLSLLMGFLLAWQLHTICLRYGASFVGMWEEDIFLDGKMCTVNFLGVMMCILEGPEGELFLSNIEVVMFSHETKRFWFESMATMPCRCCTSEMIPILREVKTRYDQDCIKRRAQYEIEP